MPLKAIVDSLDDVAEHFRELYTERNGKFEITGIEGMKTQGDVDRLQSALTKERNDHKSLKDKFSILGDKDPNDLLTQLDRIAELEAAAKGKLNDEEINKIVETRLSSKLAPVQRDKDSLAKKVEELTGQITQFQQRELTRTIHDSVRDAVGKSKGFQPSAVEDVLLFAERMFEVNEDGRVVTRDGVGVTPGVEASVWLTDMQQKKPHWWGPSEGGGSNGNRGGNGGGTNPWSHDGWNMTEQGKIYKENPDRARQLAKAAGTSLGGGRPQPRK